MGCVNCKPTLSLHAESSSKVNASTKTKKNKSLRKFLRALLLGRKKCNPQSTGTPSIGEETPSVVVQNEESDALLSYPINGVPKEADDGLRVGYDSSVQSPVVDTDCETETDQVESQLPIIDSAEESSNSSTDATAELRKERYRLSALVELKLLSEIKAELVVTSKRRDKCVKKLQLLTALKTRALQYPNYREERFSELHDAIERLTECHCHHEKELYRLKGLRAVGEAKTDHYVAKLTPELKYTDMYSEGNSFYLSPILEESDADL